MAALSSQFPIPCPGPAPQGAVRAGPLAARGVRARSRPGAGAGAAAGSAGAASPGSARPFPFRFPRARGAAGAMIGDLLLCGYRGWERGRLGWVSPARLCLTLFPLFSPVPLSIRLLPP